jgi:hypothetical protein
VTVRLHAVSIRMVAVALRTLAVMVRMKAVAVRTTTVTVRRNADRARTPAATLRTDADAAPTTAVAVRTNGALARPLGRAHRCIHPVNQLAKIAGQLHVSSFIRHVEVFNRKIAFSEPCSVSVALGR